MLVPYAELKARFKEVLVSRSMAEDRAGRCATLFADSTLEGTYTHGVNRFPVFVSQIDSGDVGAGPSLVEGLGAFERWDGNRGPGVLNASLAMDRAMAIAGGAGLGCVALGNTNHWMRGGSYGLQAARAGYIGVCWTNAIAGMPPWGGTEPRLGTNPLVIAVPGDPPVLVDSAMSQFSYGKLEEHRLKGKRLPVPGGYDAAGRLSEIPSEVEATRRLLPMGYWKGSALSMVLDMVASLLSGGDSVAGITARGRETGVSQVFLAFALERIEGESRVRAVVEEIERYVRSSAPADPLSPVRIPGEMAEAEKRANLERGIEVDDRIWERLSRL